MKKLSRNFVIAFVGVLLLLGGSALARHTETRFTIQVAEWDDWREELFVAGHGQYRCDVEIYNALNGDHLGSTYCPDKRWSITIEGEDLEAQGQPVPCRVEAVQLESDTCDYKVDLMDVQHAPEDCAPKPEEHSLWH